MAMSNLNQRIITGIILVSCLIYLLYFANNYVLYAALLGLILVSGLEWSKLIPLNSNINSIIFISGLFITVFMSHYFLYIWLYLSPVIWGSIILALIYYPSRQAQAIWSKSYIVCFMALLILPAFFSVLIRLFTQTSGRSYLSFLILLVCSCDIGGYIFGKIFGKHKLIARVSPGKTIEGVLGGLLLSLSIGIVFWYYLTPRMSIFTWSFICFITACISIVGDLSISMLKRRVGIKDTGNIFPGHGGLLDRIDSLLAALPIFYVMYILI